MTVRNRRNSAIQLKQTRKHRYWDTGTKKAHGRRQDYCALARWTHTPRRAGRRA